MKYSQRIQELPPDERPYEKCLHSGPEKLTDSELLAVVLRSGTRGSSSVQLADEVLHLGQNEQGLLGIYHLSMEDLMQIADESKLMPPKSTWFEPKLRSGIFVHKLRG